MWDQATTKLSAGPHGLDPALVERVQRERLLAAMTDAVAEMGYQDTTIAKMLRRARISKITFYELFDNKEQCFLAAYDDALAHAFERIERACEAERSAPAQQRLEAAVEALLDFLAEEPAVARLCVVEILAATMDRFAAMLAGYAAETNPGRELGPIAVRALVGGAEEVIYTAVERGDVAALPSQAGDIAGTLDLVGA
jgi:AcrR family transcriptional regulator